MKRFALCLLLVFLIHQSVSAQKDVEHSGRLNTEIKVDGGMGGFRYKLASAEEKAKLPVTLAEGDRAYAGTIEWLRKPNTGSLSVFVEPAKGAPFVYVDIDRDGKFTSKERFSFTPVTDNQNVIGEASFKFPMANSPFKYFPMKLRLPKPSAEPQKADAPKADAQKNDTRVVMIS